VIITNALELEDSNGRGTGRWRACSWSDEDDVRKTGIDPLCDCGGRSHDNPATAGHESPVAALACPVVRGRLEPKGVTSC